MLEYLPSNEDVLAIRCGGKLERGELDGFLDRMEASLARREKTHLFAEIEDLRLFEAEGLAEAAKRSGPFLRQLERIGRVAIVADQSWVRWAAKIESAVLPHVSYETFDSGERNRALAWVEGEIEAPHRPAIKVIETDDPAAMGFEIDGHVGKAELDKVSLHFLEALEGRDRVRLLGRIRNLGGFQPTGLVTSDYFAMKRGFLDRLDRYAIVGGPAWLRTTVNMIAPLFKAEIRQFEPEEEEAAWAWIGARPVTERSLIA